MYFTKIVIFCITSIAQKMIRPFLDKSKCFWIRYGSNITSNNFPFTSINAMIFTADMQICKTFHLVFLVEGCNVKKT